MTIPTRTEFQAMSLADKLACDPNVDTAERLQRVADIIEFHPDAHDQDVWWHTDGITDMESLDRLHISYSPAAEREVLVQTPGLICGTSCCGAGWGVALAPGATTATFGPSDWTIAGETVFGIGPDVSHLLFHEAWLDRESLVAAYRALASVPASERTLANFPQIREWYEDQLGVEEPDYV